MTISSECGTKATFNSAGACQTIISENSMQISFMYREIRIRPFVNCFYFVLISSCQVQNSIDSTAIDIVTARQAISIFLVCAWPCKVQTRLFYNYMFKESQIHQRLNSFVAIVDFVMDD